MSKDNQIVPYNPESKYAKSNIIIGSKFRASLLENRLMAVCFSKIPKASEDSEGTITVKVDGQELRRVFGLKGNGGDFFRRLDETASKMTGRTVGFSDPVSKRFEYTAVVTNAKFEDNVFICEFNKNLRRFLRDIETSYTLLSLSVMLSFKSNNTFRLFEILRSRCYTPKGKEKITDFEIIYSIAELKLELGVINAELDVVKRELNNKKGEPDYESAVNKSPEKTYSEWKEFKRCVIDVGVKEINSNPATKMKVSYTTIKRGQGGKVRSIVFYVHYDEDEIMKEEEKIAENNNLNDAEKEDFYDKVISLIDEKIKIRDAKAISEAAEYDIEKVRKAYNMAKKKKKIDNIVGWLISAIKDNYEETQKKGKSRTHDFEERTYDYKKLEEEFY